MRKQILATLGAIALITATAAPSLAAVNCGIVKKDLDRGRTPQDISERMGITVEDVKKCQEQAGSGTTAPPAPGTPGAPGTKPTAAPAGQGQGK